MITGAGAVHVNLTNHATGATASCWWLSPYEEMSNITITKPAGMVGPLNPINPDPGPGWYRCDIHAYVSWPDPAPTHTYEIKTSVRMTWDKEMDIPVVMLNQTWYCDDQGADKPVQFSATGSAALDDVRCEPRTTIEPDMVDLDYQTVPGAKIYNGTTCVAEGIHVEANLTERGEMPPYALESPSPGRLSLHGRLA
ncbi:hypothetical protein F5Y17DRAFT_445578 [Xylariaceae sp. FL0594]|nr:hypothetical protein F5Y17DRAFT_445578 [Xylariaceae sp. FL0594]